MTTPRLRFALLVFATAGSLFSGTGLAQATSVSYTGPPVNIPDNIPGGVNLTLPVAGIGNVGSVDFRFDTGGVCDATVGNVNAAVTHTFVGDLTFRLTAPGGLSSTFMARRGGTRENICSTTLNDQTAGLNISTLVSASGQFVAGAFRPEAAGQLSRFNGLNANGTWILNVSDNSVIDTGSIRRFSLLFSPPQPVIAVFDGPEVLVPDNITAGVNIPVPVLNVGVINDLNFLFDIGGACDATVNNLNAAVRHTFIGDLTFRLTSPGGTTAAIMARRGGTRENICASLLDDNGAFPNVSTITSVTGMPMTGSYTSETTGSLSAFNGQNANGIWVLNVSDNAGIDTGAVRRFSLVFGLPLLFEDGFE